MKCDAKTSLLVVSTLFVLALESSAFSATMSVDGSWVVTNGAAAAAGTNVVGANSNSPTFAPVAPATVLPGISVESPFPTITLANTGDYVEAEATVLLNRDPNFSAYANDGRLNGQLKIGLFDAPAPPSSGNSGDPRGFFVDYSGTTNGNIRARVGTQENPFSSNATHSPILGGSGSAGSDAEGDFISLTPVEVDFVFRITRNGSNVDLTGSVSGETVDPLDNDYFQPFSLLGHSPHASFDFDLNRVGFLIGGNTGSFDATLQDVRVRSNLIIPEPASWLLGLGLALASGLVRRRSS